MNFEKQLRKIWNQENGAIAYSDLLLFISSHYRPIETNLDKEEVRKAIEAMDIDVDIRGLLTTLGLTQPVKIIKK